MKLIWKLLRQHVSVGQLAGFFLANLLGMLIVLLSVQFYEDIIPAFSGEDGVMKNTYIIVSKRIAAVSSLSGEAQTFTPSDVRDLEDQRFVRRVGAFTASQYQVYGSISMAGMSMGTDMFFESVPDEFVDVKWPASSSEVPIILPKSYLALYNFGFAQTKNLPKLSEGLISLIQMDVRLRGEGRGIQHPSEHGAGSRDLHAPDQCRIGSRLRCRAHAPDCRSGQPGRRCHRTLHPRSWL